MSSTFFSPGIYFILSVIFARSLALLIQIQTKFSTAKLYRWDHRCTSELIVFDHLIFKCVKKYEKITQSFFKILLKCGVIQRFSAVARYCDLLRPIFVMVQQ